MFIKRSPRLDTVGDYQEQRKILPYTVTDSEKGAAMRFNKEVDLRNAQKAYNRREMAVKAFNSGSGDVRDAGAFRLTETPKAKAPIRVSSQLDSNSVYTLNKSVITRIYEWFLNINFQ